MDLLDFLPWETVDQVAGNRDLFQDWVDVVTGLVPRQRVTTQSMAEHPEVDWDQLWVTKEELGLARRNGHAWLTPVAVLGRPGYWLLEIGNYMELYRAVPPETLQ